MKKENAKDLVENKFVIPKFGIGENLLSSVTLSAFFEIERARVCITTMIKHTNRKYFRRIFFCILCQLNPHNRNDKYSSTYLYF